MGHDHAAGNLRVAFLLNLAFVVLEVAGGFWTNSIAVLSDAVHDAGDCLSLGLAWYLQRLSVRQADARFTYGCRQFSALGAGGRARPDRGGWRSSSGTRSGCCGSLSSVSVILNSLRLRRRAV